MKNLLLVQDGNGNVLLKETVIAFFKQVFCIHNWIEVGYTKECTKCHSTKNND